MADETSDQTAGSDGRQHRVAIVGSQRREFLPLLKRLISMNPRPVIRWFSSIEDALETDAEVLEGTDAVLVLQSTPDQYATRSVNTLIGRTIFGRLYCCYGPWCESDGRTRSTWPDAIRVPVRLAGALIARELQAVRQEQPSIPVTASRDEVFSYRLDLTATESAVFSDRSLCCVVLGADRVLNQTVSAAITASGLLCSERPLLHSTTFRETGLDNRHDSSVDLVVHDLDPWGPPVSESLELAARIYSSADVIGIATMPDGGLSVEIADVPLNRVVPKLDLELGLRWHLTQWATEIRSLR